VLNVPECYFYAVDDSFAEALLELYNKHQALWNISGKSK
ncbi:transcriptional regulator, partial [Klebsiella michiganensis]